MTLEAYKSIHEKDSMEKLLDLMTDEAFYISCDAQKAGWYDAIHDQRQERFYREQVEHHKKRVGWLFDTMIEKLKERDMR